MGKPAAATYNDIGFDFEYLRSKLKLKNQEAKRNFVKKYPHADQFFKNRGIELGNIRTQSAKVLGASALTGSLLLSQPGAINPLPSPNEIIEKLKLEGGILKVEGIQKLLVDNLNNILPAKTRPLARQEEKLLEQVFENVIGVKTRATLEGEHLNTTYGVIGAEQHLKRYPQDNLILHGGNFSIQKSGLAPGRGAWGYFASSKDELTSDLVEKEKWYAVVQTLYLPDWDTRQPHLKNWYKHRKVLIVNTKNGNALIAAIADSGPAAWTGKHFGGSPEVMDYLGGPKYKKGPVIVFFVDDPDNKVPLGPIEYNTKNIPDVLLTQG